MEGKMTFMLLFDTSSKHKLMEWIVRRAGLHWLDTITTLSELNTKTKMLDQYSMLHNGSNLTCEPPGHPIGYTQKVGFFYTFIAQMYLFSVLNNEVYRSILAGNIMYSIVWIVAFCLYYYYCLSAINWLVDYYFLITGKLIQMYQSLTPPDCSWSWLIWQNTVSLDVNCCLTCDSFGIAWRPKPGSTVDQSFENTWMRLG